ncbi:serine/threonine-protein kinase [Streptomyces ipomoeae]|uniref:serine/threonine-protein kinase n=1 Tax=Streptomyces ipomoeae TaxID=103232 RepID=UPI00114622F5|nr:serine/threonine-protein kinase [Streptomyces ipomoeae]MDX2936025.1 protein kinase [Streptomyces ipomoeae]TQE14720.1 serine/threonine protein phosphatase [Streptomyces ipomoeae]
MQSEAPHGGAGRVIADRYVLLNRLGSGGMGHVWLAHDQQLDCEVALKEVVFRNPGEAERDRTARVARARAEARHAAVLRDHPNVATVHDVLEYDGLPWIVMEYVPGALDLKALVTRRGALAPAECARIGLAVLDALTAGHDRGIMHRDVKPANILLAPDRTGTPYARVLLTDYGISVQPHTQETRYTRTHVLIGTAGYLAPERAQGGPPTPESDLFSLGCTLYYAVEGYGPFDRDSEIEALTAVVLSEPRPTLRAGALEPLLAAMLEKDPARRITAVDTEAALSAIVTPQAHPRTQSDLGSQPQWANATTHTAAPEVLVSPIPHEPAWYSPTPPAEPSAPADRGFGPPPATTTRRPRHRAWALLAGVATTVVLTLAVGGIWYGVENLRDLGGSGSDGGSAGGKPYGNAIGLTEPLKDGDCVHAVWPDKRFSGTPLLQVVPQCAGPDVDGQVMAFYEASSAADARAGGAAQCEQLTSEDRGLLVDVRSYPVLPTEEGFDAAGQRVVCLVLGERRPMYGPIGRHREPGKTVMEDTATIQMRDCLDKITDNKIRLAWCQDPHQSEVLGFHEMSAGTTYGKAQKTAKKACFENMPPEDYGYAPDTVLPDFWISEDGWKKGAHFVVCTVVSARGGTMEGQEA